MPLRVVSLITTVLVGAVSSVASGQTVGAEARQQPAVMKSDSDPTRPVFLSVRPEFYFLRDDAEQRALIIRYDAATLRSLRMPHGGAGAILRFDVPVVAAESGRRRVEGLGDVYGQMLLVPYTAGRFLFVAGTGFVLPTATDTLTGGGKWTVAPLTGVVWRAPGTLAYVKLQHFTSIAGDDGRPDANYLLITPTFVRFVRPDWWVLLDSETKTTWTADGGTGVKSGVQLGWLVSSNVGLWVKPESWWGANRGGRWNLKMGVVWYQRRPAQAAAASATTPP